MKKNSVRSGRFLDRRRDLSGAENTTLLFGYVVKPHGLKGDLSVKPCDGRSRNILFAKRVEISQDGLNKVFVLEKALSRNKDFLLSLQGVGTYEEAEVFRRAEVRLFREDLPPLHKDEFYLADVLGAEVVDGQGEHIGFLDRIEDTAAFPLLAVLTEEEEEILVPAGHPFIGDWNSEERRLTVDVPEGMPRYKVKNKKIGKKKNISTSVSRKGRRNNRRVVPSEETVSEPESSSCLSRKKEEA